MPPAAKHRAEVVSRRRMAKRHVLPNERWLPLSSAENDLKSTIQASLFVISTCCLAMTQLLGLLLTLEATEDMGDVDYDALDTAIKSVIIILVAYTGMLRTHGEQIASSSTSRQRRRTLLCSSPRKRPPNQRSL
jgi:hypothetical protein